MSTPEQPVPFKTYECSLGTVIDHQGGSYVIRTPSGRTIGIPANGEPSEDNVETDIANPPAPVAPVPAKIGPAQLRIALRRLHPELTPGAIYAVIAQLPTAQAQDDARDWYDYATEIQRTHPMLLQLAGAFGLTADQVDAVFRLGATI